MAHDFQQVLKESFDDGNNALRVLPSGADLAILFSEILEPSVGTGKAKVYLFDNGGTQELRIKFANGTVKTIADDT